MIHRKLSIIGSCQSVVPESAGRKLGERQPLEVHTTQIHTLEEFSGSSPLQMEGTDMAGFSPCAHKCSNGHGIKATKTPNARYPCFLKKVVEYNLRGWMQIPKAFLDLHRDELCGNVIDLESHNSKVWLVKVAGPEPSLTGFRLGWKVFATDNNLKEGDQLLFSLVSKSRFSVQIFNKYGLEARVPSATSTEPKRSQNGKQMRDKGEGDGKENREPDAHSDDSNGYESLESNYSSPSEDASEVGYARKSPRVKPEKMDSETLCCYNPQDSLAGYDSETQNQVLRQSSLLRSYDNEKKTLRSDLTKMSGVKRFHEQQNSAGEPGWKSRTFQSRRRAVTDAEREKAIAAASSFKTKNPSIMILMRPSQVYRGFWLSLTATWSKKHMPHQKMQIRLEDSFGFQWSVTWVGMRTGLSGGWGNFSRDHCLEEGDICVFELKDAIDCVLLVHIFRVVDVDLVPGTRGGWDKTYKVVFGELYHDNEKMEREKLKEQFKKFKFSSGPLRKQLAKGLYAAVMKARHKAKLRKKTFNAEATENDNYAQRNGEAHANSEFFVHVKPEIGFIRVKHEACPQMTPPTKAKKQAFVSNFDVKPTSEELSASLQPTTRQVPLVSHNKKSSI